MSSKQFHWLQKSKILVIGGTGYIGKFIVEASAKAGHPTFVLVLECPLSNNAKSKIIHHLITLGAFFVFVRKHQHLSYIFNVITYVYSNIRPCFCGGGDDYLLIIGPHIMQSKNSIVKSFVVE